MRIRMIGIIGGTGLDNPEILLNRSEVDIDPNEGHDYDYGLPSDVLIKGEVGGIPCCILARHGRKHHLNPSNVNYRANLLALKQAGCDLVIATHSIGSLIEQYKPGDFVLLDQFIDRTVKRDLTYYDNSPTSMKGVCHTPMGLPYDTELRRVVLEASKELQFPLHPTGTCVAIEGPRFSTRAESLMFRGWGCHVIGMTQVPEAQLAKELDLPFVAIGMVTDYDAWKVDEAHHVTVAGVIKILKENGDKMIELLKGLIPIIAKAECWREHHRDGNDIL